MLVININLVPGGNPELRRTIASLLVANISGLSEISDYAVDVTEGANTLTGAMSRTASCTAERHDRRQAVWALLAKAATAAMRAEFDEL